MDTFAASLPDAIEGALLGMMIGDALAAPLHWLYTWPETQRIQAAHFGGGVTHYSASPATAHPDSSKYFSRCRPAAQPVAAIFGPPEAAAQWAVPGTFYHAGLPPGDNTLTARLVARLVAHVGSTGGLHMDSWFAQGYMAMLQRQGGPSASHADLWVDESHRVLFENLAAGALPYEAGMDDLCLTGINLALPLLLAYNSDRDASELAARCLLQLTHKNEDMVQQCLWWGDLMRAILARTTANATATAAATAAATTPTAPVQQCIDAIFSSFSPLSLSGILASGLTPPQVYHGDAAAGLSPIFSSR